MTAQMCPPRWRTTWPCSQTSMHYVVLAITSCPAIHGCFHHSPKCLHPLGLTAIPALRRCRALALFIPMGPASPCKPKLIPDSSDMPSAVLLAAFLPHLPEPKMAALPAIFEVPSQSQDPTWPPEVVPAPLIKPLAVASTPVNKPTMSFAPLR